MTTVLSERRKWERGRQRPRCFKSSFRIINIWAKTTTTTATHFELCMTDRRKWSETKTSSRTHSQIWKPNWWKCAKERRAKEEKRKKVSEVNGNGEREWEEGKAVNPELELCMHDGDDDDLCVRRARFRCRSDDVDGWRLLRYMKNDDAKMLEKSKRRRERHAHMFTQCQADRFKQK